MMNQLHLCPFHLWSDNGNEPIYFLIYLEDSALFYTVGMNLSEMADVSIDWSVAASLDWHLLNPSTLWTIQDWLFVLLLFSGWIRSCRDSLWTLVKAVRVRWDSRFNLVHLHVSANGWDSVKNKYSFPIMDNGMIVIWITIQMR